MQRVIHLLNKDQLIAGDGPFGIVWCVSVSVSVCVCVCVWGGGGGGWGRGEGECTKLRNIFTTVLLKKHACMSRIPKESLGKNKTIKTPTANSDVNILHTNGIPASLSGPGCTKSGQLY